MSECTYPYRPLNLGQMPLGEDPVLWHHDRNKQSKEVLTKALVKVLALCNADPIDGYDLDDVRIVVERALEATPA